MLFNVYAGEGGQFITRTSMLKVVQQCEGKTNVDGFRALFKSVRRPEPLSRGPWGGDRRKKIG